MSGFTALNVEPEDTFEEEIDDTKEIQLEEAFKLYQNALKLHSQGPDFFQDAREAYRDLFNSEVFKYPEAVSEYAHDQLDEEPAVAITPNDTAALSLLPSNAADSSATSIPQLIYLSFKNRGQFVLDVARQRLDGKSGSRAELCQYYAESCRESLIDFAGALERDDSDLDLWKKAARVADVLSTQRIVRFCLESVLAGDDDGTEQTIDLSGLDEAFAAGELEEVIDILQDDLTRARRQRVRPKDALLHALKKVNDPYRFLPQRAPVLEYLDDRRRPLSFGIPTVTLRPASRDFWSIGQALLQTITTIQESSTVCGTSTLVLLELPETPLAHDDESAKDAHEADAEKNTAHDRTSQAVNESDLSSALPLQEGRAGGVDDASDKSSAPQHRQINGTQSQLDVGGTADIQPESERIPGTALNEPADQDGPSSRKRSTTVAGNEEFEGRAKSKRLRARESLADLAAQDEETIQEVPPYYEDQLASYEQADQAMLAVISRMLSQLDIHVESSVEQFKEAFWQDPKDDGAHADTDPMGRDAMLLRDLRNALMTWTDQQSHAIVNGHGNQEFVEKSTGLALFLQHSKAHISKEVGPSERCDEAAMTSFTDFVSAGPTNLFDAALDWLESILTPSGKGGPNSLSSYMRETWPAEVKQTVLQLMTEAESHIYESLLQRHTLLEDQALHESDSSIRLGQIETSRLFELTQTLFELHLDIHSRNTNPSSQVDNITRISQGDRLQRWATLADEVMRLYLRVVRPASVADRLVLRFIWASTTYANLAEEVDKAHILLCLQDLRKLIGKANMPSIILPNNEAMPQISIAAVDQEVSRLSTLDFFMTVFDSDNSDPVAVVEMLEPLLERTVDIPRDESESMTRPGPEIASQAELIKFLESGDAALKLFLWRRLQNAYTAISYNPKVVSCLLRSIETIVNELYTARHASMEESNRHVSMLKWLRDIDELVIKVLVKVLNEANACECIDDAHLRASLRVVSMLARLLHGFVLYEDSVRVGRTPGPQLKGAAAAKMYDKSKDRFREMLVRVCTLQYALLKEATAQNKDLYPHAEEDLAEYLSTVHHALGVRHYCKYSNKAFIKLVKTELGTLTTEKDYAAEMAQVFFDLYQLRFIAGVGDANHGCPVENLDKKTAWSLVPTVMKYASRLTVRDLIKSELKGTIDKIQQALGVVKSSPQMLYNKRLISAFLKSPVIPTELYRCVRGIGDLPTKPVHADTQLAASHGWYFLLGYTTLAKYKSVKRVNLTAPTDDLDIAATFLRQDLDHGIEKWETWYRLAQVYEAKIEDDLIWNSTKLNDSRGDIAVQERNAIHCYTMAIAVAMRSADDAPETVQNIECLFADFALRLYASSRPPLNMEAFRTDRFMRHLSSSVDRTMSKEPYYPPISQYALWKFAAYLLQKKFTNKPKSWLSLYTLGKCLWKMFHSAENLRARQPVTAEAVLEAFTEAIDALPKKEKTNEYILEPHFKLVSVVHKMVHGRIITTTQATEYLQATRYAQNVHLAEDDQGPEWVPYILEILKRLGHADKSNWHHRITARAAHVIYDEQPDVAGALGAKHQFTQQIFTKTMTFQVWKPEYERPGRHYIYTGRYVSFFVHLLDQLNDRASLDQLLRRIRRKTTEFLDHTKIWEEVATTYVRLLRRIGKIPEGRERAVFDGLSHEEFTNKSEKMEKWAHDPDTTSVILDIMRDAIDLKRLNNSLMKGTLIDDLIGDSYACLYEAFVSQLPPQEQPPPPPAPLPQGTFINMTAEMAPSGDENQERMRLNNVLRAQGDGPSDMPLAVTISAPVGLGLHTPTHQFTGTPPPPALTEPVRNHTPSKPGRAKTITKREVQRKAEAAIVKPPPIKTPILSKRPVELPSTDRENFTGIVDEAPDKRLADVKDEEGPNSRASSRRGSVHDSADAEPDTDEESELSELDDLEEEKKAMFAGLTMGPKKDKPLVEEGSVNDQVHEQGEEDVMEEDDEVEIQDSQEAVVEKQDPSNLEDLAAGNSPSEHAAG